MRNSLQRLMLRSLALVCRGTGLALALASCAAQARAECGCRHHAVPEIDPGSLVAALTLTVGGVLLVSDRWRRKS